MDFSHIPYCGRPPSPAELWLRWNLDPVLIVSLAVLGLVYGLGARKARIGAGRRRSFYAGWVITSLALISPLCPLSVSLFEARVGQHMILTLIGAPLVAMGRPWGAFVAALSLPPTLLAPGRGAAKTSIVAAGLFALLLWYWHTPIPYGFTFQSTLVYWMMHLTLYGSALWLWSALQVQAGRNAVWHVAAGLFSTVQMGLLGALITLAPRPMYAPHFLTTVAWGLTPLQDQQLGGVIMWVPGCLAFLAAAMAELALVIAGPGGPRPSTAVAR